MGGFTIVTPAGAELGRRARARLPRPAQAELPDVSRDPVLLLAGADSARVPELLPLRHERMAASTPAYFAGSTAVLAHDLAAGPHSGLFVQSAGDAQLLNFGVYETPDRGPTLDLGDFDETLEAPFEWDLKRLAVSVAVVARLGRLSAADRTQAAVAVAAGYRRAMAGYVTRRALDVWYDQIPLDELLPVLRPRRPGRRAAAAVRASDRQAAKNRELYRSPSQLTEQVGGVWRLREQAPLLVHTPADDELLRRCLREYRQTLSPDRRLLLDRYRVVDHARWVVGVAGVGARCWAVLLAGAPNDRLVLQVKEAGPSVLEWHLTPSPYPSSAQRVAEGQRLLQTGTDVLLGWFREPAGGRHYYIRQVWEADRSIDLTELGGSALATYAGFCGRVLARAHARSGDPAAIDGYLGRSDKFDRALARFAERYAEVVEADRARFTAALRRGLPPAEVGGRFPARAVAEPSGQLPEAR